MKPLFSSIMMVGFCLCCMLLISNPRTIAYGQTAPGSATLSPELNNLFLELEEFGRKNNMLNAPRTDGMFLRMIVEMIGAKQCLEIGSSDGYSSIWIGTGLKERNGHLTTLEIDPVKVKLANENYKKAGLDKIITLVEGDALKNLPTLSGPFDFVFIDAWKNDYYKYFQMVFPKVRAGGVIVAHNAISAKDAMKDYLDTVKNHPDLETVILSTTLQDGMAISYKRK